MTIVLNPVGGDVQIVAIIVCRWGGGPRNGADDTNEDGLGGRTRTGSPSASAKHRVQITEANSLRIRPSLSTLIGGYNLFMYLVRKW